MTNTQIIQLLLNVISKLIALIDSLDTDKKLTDVLKTNTDDLAEALKNAPTPEGKP